MSLNDIDRISNLWKKSRGVNDIRKISSYVNPAQTAFKENIFNDTVFSQEVPDELPGNLINSNIGTVHPESVEYLDWSFNQVGVDPGQIPGIPGPNTPQLGPFFGTRLTSVPHLTYYHRIPLFPNNNADDTLPTGVTKSTWYLPDPSDNKLSLLRDTINFKTGTKGHYVYNIWAGPPGLVAGQLATAVQEVADPYSLVFDNKNGLLYLYGDDSASNWTIGGGDEIYISFIRYEGSKGAAGGSGGGGGITPGSDVSFNNVDISSNLNIIHNGLETGILQSKSIALDSHSIFQFPRSTVLAEISYSGTQNPMTVTGYFTIELNEGDPHSYTKIHFIAGVMTKDGTGLSSPGGYDYNCFIKVLNVNRAAYGQIANPGIHRIEIWKNTATDRVFLAVNHEVLGNPRVKVRLYKNGPNELNVTNELQWTLGKTTILNGFGQHTEIKSIYIAAAPDGGINPVYPDHPVESFSATTEYTIIDNSMNVYGNVNITGDVDIGDSLKIENDLSVAGTSNLNNVFLNTSETLLTELYSSKIFNNSNFLSDGATIANGAWQTIAYMPILYYGDLNVRASYALFEVSDRSNRDSAHAFKDTLKFIVNITESGTRTASCSLSLLSSNASRNEVALPNSGVSSSETTSVTGDYGYIEKIRVLLGTVNLPISETNPTTIERIGAMVQLYRKSDAPTTTASFSATTDLRVLMYNNMKILREGQDSNGYAPFVLDTISEASYWRSGTQKYDVDFNLLEESSGHKNVHKGYQGNIIYGYTSSAFSKVSSDFIVSEDVSSNLIRGDIVRATNGEMDELDVGTGADDIKVNRKYGGTTSNPTHNTNPQVISGGSGRESKINSRPDHHGQLTNRAYVQEEVIRVVPSGVSPGIVVANNDWITIAKLGPFDKGGAGQIVSRNSFRGTALFELQDRSGSHHHNVKFIATFEFNKACLKVIHNSFYSANRFNEIRIKYGGTYQGAVLQFSIDTGHSFSNTGQNLYLKIWQNTNDTGWVCTQDFIQVENTPNIYVPNNIQGGYDTNGNWVNSGQDFGNPYPNTESVNVSENHTNDNNFYERFKNGILVQGGTSDIAMGGGDLELEGGNIMMNSSTTGTGVLEMTNGNITGINNINGIKLIDGDGGNNNILTIRTTNTGFTSSTTTSAVTGYLKFDSPFTMPTNNGSLCNASLNNAATATFAYNKDNNTIMYNPDSATLPNVGGNLIVSNTSTMILWDWVTLFNGATPTSSSGYTPFFSPSYSTRGGFSPYQFAPSHLNPTSGGSDLPLLYDKFKPVHDGFLTGVTFKTAYMSNSNNVPLISIERVYGFGISSGASTFELICTVKDASTGQTTEYKVGNLLVGPGPGPMGTGTLQTDSQTGDMPYNFTINPRSTLIKFNKLDEIDFKVKWVNRSFTSDKIRVSISDAGGGGSTVASIIAYFKYYVDS